MLVIQGIYKDGVVHLNKPVDWENGQSVIITLVPEEKTEPQPMVDGEWDEFEQLIEECQIEFEQTTEERPIDAGNN